MAHGYRTLQHWNQWLAQQFLGRCLLEAEGQQLKQLLGRHFGKHALLLGVPEQHELLKSTHIPCHSLLSPLICKEKITNYVEGGFDELPILTGSIDLVMLPHTLEFVDNPRQLLAEACRIIKPEGLIMICGFNPYSAWGLKRWLVKHKGMPWAGNFIQPRHVKNWVQLAEFEMEKQTSFLFTPPINHPPFYHKMQAVERIGRACFPLFGGIYMILARATVVPLTPIRLKWKQPLSRMRIPTTISGHIAHRTK